MNVLISYLSGLLAAFSPCVIVLIPLTLYRFFNRDKKQIKSFIFFIFGFLGAYLLFSLLLSRLFSSSIQNGLKLGLGVLFSILGILAFLDRINPFNVPLIKNSFLLGISFSFFVSLSPCTIPYVGITMALSSKSLVFFNLLFFGLGLISPAIVFSFIGQNVINFAKKQGKIFHSLNRVMSLILFFSGLYLAMTLSSFNFSDLYLALILMLLTFFILLKAFFIVNSFKDFLRIDNLILIFSLILIIGAVLVHCHNNLSVQNTYNFLSNQNNNFVVSSNVVQNVNKDSNSCEAVDCPVCKTCSLLFFFATLLSFLVIFGFSFFKRRK